MECGDRATPFFFFLKQGEVCVSLGHLSMVCLCQDEHRSTIQETDLSGKKESSWKKKKKKQHPRSRHLQADTDRRPSQAVPFIKAKHITGHSLTLRTQLCQPQLGPLVEMIVENSPASAVTVPRSVCVRYLWKVLVFCFCHIIPCKAN